MLLPAVPSLVVEDVTPTSISVRGCPPPGEAPLNTGDKGLDHAYERVGPAVYELQVARVEPFAPLRAAATDEAEAAPTAQFVTVDEFGSFLSAFRVTGVDSDTAYLMRVRVTCTLKATTATPADAPGEDESGTATIQRTLFSEPIRVCTLPHGT